jgi:TRAP-type C4-dicarboxylate transport system substrate-binding protein
MRRTTTALALALALTLGATPALAQQLPATQFNVVGTIGNLSMYTQREVPFWNERIPRESGGQIKVQVKPFTELGFRGPEIFRLVSQGTLPFASTVLNYNSGEVPINEAADLVGLVSSVGDLQKVVNVFRDTLAKEYETKHNIKLLGFGTYQAQVIYCRQPFTTIADLKGRKVRASGASQQAFVSHIGGSPVTIAFAEVQPALATGVVDCAITGALSGFRSRWHEAATHISPMPINFGLVAHLANLTWWNSQPAPVRAFLEKEMRWLEDQIFEQAKSETELGLACNTAQASCPDAKPPRPMTLVPATEADSKLRVDALEKAIIPSFAQRCGADCVKLWNATIGQSLGITIK